MKAASQLSQDSQAPDAAPPPKLWIEPAALADSLVAFGCAALLCFMVVAACLDWHRLPWRQGAGSVSEACLIMWLPASIAAL